MTASERKKLREKRKKRQEKQNSYVYDVKTNSFTMKDERLEICQNQ